jgi:hypothetical protein
MAGNFIQQTSKTRGSASALMSASSSVEEFWQAINSWAINRISIATEIVRAGQPKSPERFTAKVTTVDKPNVFIRETKSGTLHSIDFADAHISFVGFDIVDPLGMVRIFEATWENSKFIRCTFMEPRETAIEIDR